MANVREVRRIDLVGSLPFLGVHVAAVIGACWVGVTPRLLGWMLLSYLVRVWAVSAGYHRYFAHHAFRTSRAFQLALAVLACLAVEKGPLWWVAQHRWHHRHSDEEEDVHSPTLRGLFWAHAGWIITGKDVENYGAQVKDLARFPEMRWLDRWFLVPPIAAGALLWLAGGTAVFVWAGLVATVLQWHAVFLGNSVCHTFGRRRFATADTSRNNFLCAILVLGEGWHNNHHFAPSSARLGFDWWEIDPVYYTLKLLEKMGLIWDLGGVPAHLAQRATERSPAAA